MEKGLITIIVPVYNGEKYLLDLQNMLQRQTINNWECIIVDDGSADNTKKIVEEIARNDSRFKLSSQMNQGVSSARNRGISEASGEYIAFIDVDDYVYPNYLEYLQELLLNSNADISSCGCQKGVQKNDSLIESNYTRVYSTRECIEEIFYRKTVPGYAYAKLYKREAAEHLFNTNIKYGEDFIWTYQAIAKAGSVVYGSKELYFYYQNPNSATHRKPDYKSFNRTFEYLTKDLWEDVEQRYPEALSALRAKIFINTIDYCTRIWNIKEAFQEKKIFVDYLNNNKKAVMKDKAAKNSNRLLACIAVWIGCPNMIRLCNTYLWIESKGIIQRKKSV